MVVCNRNASASRAAAFPLVAAAVASLLCFGNAMYAVPNVHAAATAYHPYSVFVSLKVHTDPSGRMNVALQEVSETDGYHLTDYERVEVTSQEELPHLLKDHNASHHHHGTVTLTKQYATHRFRLSYVDPVDGATYARIVPDPRLLYLDSHGDSRVSEAKKTSSSQVKGHKNHHHHSRPHIPDDFDGSDAHISDVGYIFEWLPPQVSELTVHYMNMSFPIVISLTTGNENGNEPHRRVGAYTLDSSSDSSVILKTYRNSGPPDRVNSIVFLSDGFLAQSNQTFFDRVTTILGLIDESDPSNADPALLSQKNTVPLDRYIAFWNVYAVFQPSSEEGCSRPLYGITVNDNLKCYHTPQLERAIQCDRSLALSLAKVSPAPLAKSPDNVLIIVVVNTAIYGGTGLYYKGVIHIGHFFNGSDMLTVGTADNSYTGKTTTTYASLINHECGHAMGHLLDEYAMGYAATSPYTNWTNCLMPDSTGSTYYSPIPWQKWINVFSNSNNATTYLGRSAVYLISAGYGTLSTPSAVCGYSNYYKGSSDCMMNHLNAYYMCPQCREGYSRSIYNTSFELQWPRYPLLDHILIVARTSTTVQGLASGVTLHLPVMLSSSQYFAVTWYDHNGDTISTFGDTSCPSCLYINNSVMQSWPTDGTVITYTAKIEDQSVYIFPADRAAIPNMTQYAPFRMMVQPDDMELTTATAAPSSSSGTNSSNSTTNSSSYTLIKYPAAVTGSETPAYGYFTTNTAARAADQLYIYVICSPQTEGKNATCSLNFTQNSYNSPSDPDSLAQYDAYVLYVLGGVAAACVLLWLYAASRYKKSAGRVVRPIFKTQFSAVITLIRRIMMVSSIVFMFGAVGALATSGYFYTKTSFIGKVVIIGGVVVALCLYLMAFVGFWAITNRAKRLVMFNGIIMIVAEAVLVAALVLVNLIGDTINNDGSTFSTILTNWWTSNVANDPANACGWEGMLTCSGWQLSCDGTFYVATMCPSNCNTYNNEYGTSCQSVIRDIITKWYPIVAACLAVAIGLMGFAIAFNYIYYFALWHMKQRIREANNNRVYRATARDGISRATVDKAKALFVLRTLDTGDVQHLVKEFKRIDADGSGTLSKKELALFFRKALCYKITLDELNKLYDAMDLDGDGSISLEEFLAVFKHHDGPMLRHPSSPRGGGGLSSAKVESEIPLISSQRMERQQLVRDRLNSAFEVPEEPRKPAVAFQPQAMTTMSWPVRPPPPTMATTVGTIVQASPTANPYPAQVVVPMNHTGVGSPPLMQTQQSQQPALPLGYPPTSSGSDAVVKVHSETDLQRCAPQF